MICPCCSGGLLRHVGRHGVYWYCLNCRQSMPNPTSLGQSDESFELDPQPLLVSAGTTSGSFGCL